MRHALALSLAALLLGGCASNPADRDISGTWINQVAIDAAAKGGPLREALQAHERAGHRVQQRKEHSDGVIRHVAKNFLEEIAGVALKKIAVWLRSHSAQEPHA